GIVFSYITQSRVVFRNAGRATLLKFLIAWVLIYFINISIIYLLIQASINAYLAGAIATLPVTLISYLILKLAVFVRQKTS
ncbi:MAG: GtrA family protein, partial [Azonexus sp.]|nr:GtrA family protein [Azonexus sp.]